MLAIIIAVAAVILVLTGSFVQSLQFLIWVGIVCAIVAVVMFVMRSVASRD